MAWQIVCGYDTLALLMAWKVALRSAILMRAAVIILTVAADPAQALSLENIQAPGPFIKHMYQKSRILVLAHSNHLDGRVYSHLEQLLRSVGTDKNLKYIVLERPFDNHAFYEGLSRKPFGAVMASRPFATGFSRRQSLCQDEWAASIADLLPLVRALNKRRSPSNPLLVTSIDSISSTAPFLDDPQATSAVKTVDCRLAHDRSIMFSSSRNRERGTARHFISGIHSKPGKNQKAIVVYHYMHVVKSFRSCFPFQSPDGGWHTQLSPANWLSYFFSAAPAAQATTKIILFDGTDEGPLHENTLKAAVRMAATIPGKDWAMESAHLSPAPEKGIDAFADDSFIRHYHEGKHFSSRPIAGMFDAVVWTDKPQARFSFKTAHEYLPGECPDH